MCNFLLGLITDSILSILGLEEPHHNLNCRQGSGGEEKTLK